MEIEKYNLQTQNYRVSASSNEDFQYNGDALVRNVLNKAALKYYNKSLIEHLNSKLFSNKLTANEKKQIELSYTNPTSEKYYQVTRQLGLKYQKILDKILEEDESYNDHSELHLYIYNQINWLFFLEEVQEELIKTVFTLERKESLFNYFKLVKNNMLEKVTPKIYDKWSAQSNFYEIVNSTELFWPQWDYLKLFFENSAINSKTTRLVNLVDKDNNEMDKAYQRYFKQGYSFYTTTNASSIFF